jgi:2-oxoglutarate ferredoxin oxidoreductase subunit beta
MDNLSTYREVTWCPGCGNFGILNAFKKAVLMLEERGVPRSNVVVSSGIGCHAKISQYLRMNSIHSIHGRSMATVQGIKLANPNLSVITFAGDGDAMGEGISHLIFAAKRNADITVVLHNNGVYALTTGQFTPTSEKGFRGPSTPRGSLEEPLNPLVVALDAGATFVARGYPVKLDHLAGLMRDAILHPGFSFIEVLQPCVSFNNTYEKYSKLVAILEEENVDSDRAMSLARRKDRLPLGVIYRAGRPVFHSELYGDWNPVVNRMPREARIGKVSKILGLP